jgi:hypothetical protein
MWRRGQALVEFALVVPLLLMLLLAVIGYGWVLFSSLTVSNGARQGVRWAVVGATPCQVWDAVDGMIAPAHPQSPPVVEFVYGEGSTPACSIPSANGYPNCTTMPTLTGTPGQPVTVLVFMQGTPVIPVPGFAGSSFQLTGQATMMMESTGVQSLPSSCPTG